MRRWMWAWAVWMLAAPGWAGTETNGVQLVNRSGEHIREFRLADPADPAAPKNLLPGESILRAGESIEILLPAAVPSLLSIRAVDMRGRVFPATAAVTGKVSRLILRMSGAGLLAECE